MVKVFTIVKNEADIVMDWVAYHGSLFGLDNLHVIDNESTDGTYEALLKSGVHVYRESDYTRKGDYMTDLIRKHCDPKDVENMHYIAYPMDIDEFVVLYDRASNRINCDRDAILKYMAGLAPKGMYKTNYIYSMITRPEGYARATVEAEWGRYLDYGKVAKTFVDTRSFRGRMDHGNHNPTNDFIMTDLCLVHYHCRNLEQMKEKVLNNIRGFGYPSDANALKAMLARNKDCCAHHHVRNHIAILEGTYALELETPIQSSISLEPLAATINRITLL